MGRGVSRSSVIKVLFILPNLRGGGAERMTLTLLRNIQRDQILPSLFLLNGEGNYWNEVPNGIEVSFAAADGMRIRGNLRAAITHLRNLARDASCFVGCLELDATYIAATLGQCYHRPVIGWVHTPIQPYLQTVPWKHRSLVRWIYPRLSQVVFPSETAAESMKTSICLPAEKCRIIPDGIDLNQITSAAEAPLPEWAIRIFNRPVVISVGRLEARKNFQMLIDTHAYMRQMGYDHHLLILGEGDERKILERRSIEKGVNDSVFLPGFIVNPYPLMKRSSVYVHPSQIEGFGLGILEAQSLEVPVVATACSSSVIDLLDGGNAGSLSAVDDYSELCADVIQLLGDANKRASLAKAGYENSKRYSIGPIAKEWEKLLCATVN